METTAISKFKATCLAVLQRVTRLGKPLAEVAPSAGRPRGRDWIGAFQSRGRIKGDIVSPAIEEKDWEFLRP